MLPHSAGPSRAVCPCAARRGCVRVVSAYAKRQLFFRQAAEEEGLNVATGDTGRFSAQAALQHLFADFEGVTAPHCVRRQSSVKEQRELSVREPPCIIECRGVRIPPSLAASMRACVKIVRPLNLLRRGFGSPPLAQGLPQFALA
jgi:hypothetical protein